MEMRCGERDCNGECNEAMITMASEVLAMGELLVYPTETLYGLGADASRPGCVEKVRELKGSPAEQGISVAYTDVEQAATVLGELPDMAWELAKEFTPGPLTLVVEMGGRTEGIRIPDHPFARKLIRELGPITSTSANLHGCPSPREMKTAREQLGNEVKLYIDCGTCRVGEGSTVVKVTDVLEILREGAIGREELGEYLEY